MKTKHQPKQKAYQVNLHKILYGYEYGEVMCYAENRNKAKSKLWQLLGDANLNNWKEDEVNYLNIPVIRYPEADKFEFEGEFKTKWQIEEIKEDRKRIEELYDILENPEISHCYIRKGSYYRPNSAGYTDYRHRAGVYTKEDAVRQAKSCRDLTIIPIDIQEHNAMLNEEIKDLQIKLL